MRLGAVLPTYEIPADPVAIKDFAQATEQLGYTHLSVMDEVAGVDLVHRTSWEGRETLLDFHEPFVLFGYLANVTRRLEFFTSVLVLPQRQTLLVAKQAAEVDVLSQGRLRLGVGVGWAEPGFQALNEDFRTRGARLEEQVAVLRALFTQESVMFHGRWHHLEEFGIRPLPVQRPIPLWLGGSADVSLRRAAVIGDGWFPLMAPDDGARRAVERLHEYARAAGRDPRQIGIEAAVEIANKSPDDWQREVASWQALGATRVTVYTLDAGLTSLQAHIDVLRRFKEAATSAAQD